ncbi:hypothetical protein PsorP6_016007 [Peronosclerospora sorghi]|uniref:Uncharacterized protein n=1 Tax=Peronosclerospora sorghi TaxID=230839 RepID=A0ACC0WQD7_9STRA|nr:hypothetical protein PsorP6_016007 [Peronosclerospora sorghi]
MCADAAVDVASNDNNVLTRPSSPRTVLTRFPLTLELVHVAYHAIVWGHDDSYLLDLTMFPILPKRLAHHTPSLATSRVCLFVTENASVVTVGKD